MKQYFHLGLLAVLFVFFAPGLARAQSPADQAAAEDDWSLPAYAKKLPNSGVYGGYNYPDGFKDVEEIQLIWRKINPSEGVYDWSKLEAALASGKNVWVRFFASDVAHCPAWLPAKYPSLKVYNYRWPGGGYDDVTGYDDGGTSTVRSNGDFFAIWDPRFEGEFRKLLQSFGAKGFGNNPHLKFSYFPHGWRWNEFSLKWVPEMHQDGVTPDSYLAWFERTAQDYQNAFSGNAGKLVYTGGGVQEWVEWDPSRLPEANWNDWNQKINLNARGGGNTLSQYCVDHGLGVRDGFTEAFNHFSQQPDWGTTLTTNGSFRYSVVDENNALVKSNERFFGTENEDFDSLWPDVKRYYYYKMATLNMLHLRMNWAFLGDYQVAPDLLEYMKITSGQHAATSPDAWVALRQYKDDRVDNTENIRNFERWLVQREQPDGRTVAAYRVDFPAAFGAENAGGAYEGLRTDRSSGSNYMYFGVDDAFIKGGSTDVEVKVTYLDNFAGNWELQYDGSGGAYQGLGRTNANDGRWKTATFRLPDAQFNNRQSGGMDFRLFNGGGNDLTVRFVRVVKAQDPSGTSNTNSPPVVSLTAPSANANPAAGANILLTASASDSDGSIAKVEFYQGATKLGESTTSPYSFTWTAVAAGSYSLTAKATDDKGASTTSAPVAIAVTNGSPPANNTFNGVYKLTARHSGKCLDVAGGPGATADGTPVHQWEYGGGLNQQWRVEGTGGGYYKLTAVHSGKVLDVPASSLANGTALQQWTDNGSGAQRWNIEATSDGYYKLVNQTSGKCLDVAGGPGATANGIQVQQWDYVGGLNQQWKFDLLSASRAAAGPAPAAAPAALIAFPNPSVDGWATLVFTAAAAQTATVYVRNGQGALVGLFTVPMPAGQTKFRLPVVLAPGTYYVQTRLDGGPQTFTLKVE